MHNLKNTKAAKGYMFKKAAAMEYLLNKNEET
jgi:hypothetical protein